jgi:alpha-glucosidase
MSEARQWWQDGTIYQIYPRSFQDSNGDGIGDLAGIATRLDALVELGVAAVWVSPFYPSPMADFGYDVADYTNVDPIFGTLDDFDRLLAAIHQRGLKLILDFVPNHTSDQHPWFLASRSSRDDLKRDWYLWRDPQPDGAPPNNWKSNFGGSGWTFDPATGQSYHHSFLSAQPDLNWHNPEVRAAMYAAMRFWLDRGVDGFRMDVLWLLLKDAAFRDNLPNPEWTPGAADFWSLLPTYTADQPETHAVVAEMRAVLDAYPGRVLIGEIYLPVPDLIRYYGVAGAKLNGAQMPFNFHLIQTEWSAEPIAHLIRDYEAALPAGAWPNWVLGNHDQARVASRIGPLQARAAAMLLLTLRGTPTLYYGDELGMTNGRIAPSQVQDPAEKSQPGIGMGRDPERTPMLWDASDGAGFTTGTPWLPLNPDYRQTNVAVEAVDDRSMLTLYRRLLALRRTHPALHAGAISEVRAKHGVLSYVRSCDLGSALGSDPGSEDDAHFQVLLNLTNDIQTVSCDEGRIVLTTILDGEGAPVRGSIVLEAGEGLLVQLL